MKKLLINRSTDPAFNLALEEIIASDYPFEAVMLWRNASSIIVGRNQNTEAEIDADAVRERGIKVVRRITGGGAVYHDLGNINYTIAVNDRQLDSAAFARNASVIVDVLNDFGIDAQFKGRNDILVDGRKVSGSAKSILQSRTLFHGTLLFDADLSVLSKVLTPDEEKIKAKGIKSIRSRVANLREFLPQWDTEMFLSKLTDGICRHMNISEITPLPEDVIRMAEYLANRKYRTWEWNFGSNTEYSYHRKGRFACGTVAISFNVSDNVIADLLISGDFFGTRPTSELAGLFNGKLPRRDIVAEVLANVDVAEFIGGMTSEDLLSLFAFTE